MTPLRPWIIVLLAGCSPPALQLVSGAVAPGKAGTAQGEMRAVRAGELVAAVPLAAAGTFTLPLPAGEGTRFELAGADGAVLGSLAIEPEPGRIMFAEMEVCEPGSPIDLGEIEITGECFPSSACTDARVALTRCFADGAALITCGACAEGCSDAFFQYVACRSPMSSSSCEEAAIALAICVERAGCGASASCPCSGLQHTVSAVCQRCGGGGRILVAARPPPSAVGCEP